MVLLRGLLLYISSLGAAAWPASNASIEEVHMFARKLAAAGIGQVVLPENLGVPMSASMPLSEVSPWPGNRRLEGVAATPTVLMHGMGDTGNGEGMEQLRVLARQQTRGYATSVEICSEPTKLKDCPSEDAKNSFLMPMLDQVDQFARVVAADPNLKGGFNAMGLSQGNLVLRGYIERYNKPPVLRWISFHGPHMGVSSFPKCPTQKEGMGVICSAVNKFTNMAAYSSTVQSHLAQSNYYRNPMDLDNYRRYNVFLPDINNEVRIPFVRNDMYKANFQKLEKLVLVKAERDTMIFPRESQHFGYFKDGSTSELLDMEDAPWYKEDWFGLLTLDQKSPIVLLSTSGDHLDFGMQTALDLIDKYFTGEGDIAAIHV